MSSANSDDFEDVSVIFPWRSTDNVYRRRAFRFVRNWWDVNTTAELIVGRDVGDFDGPLGVDRPWIKALAIMNGLRQARRPYVIVHDADVLMRPSSLRNTMDLVRSLTVAWAVPFRQVYRLREDATRTFLDRAPSLASLTRLAGCYTTSCEQVHPGHPGGGIVLARREVLLDVPPDPRFKGWGQEDDAWAIALRVLRGLPYRYDASLYHLWHPPQARLDRVHGSQAGVALYDRYHDASRLPQGEAIRAVRALVDDGWRERGVRLPEQAHR